MRVFGKSSHSPHLKARGGDYNRGEGVGENNEDGGLMIVFRRLTIWSLNWDYRGLERGQGGGGAKPCVRACNRC